MKAVFLDSIGGAAARSSLAAETPSQLINCYLVFPFVHGTAKLKGGRNRSASTADDCNFDRFLLGQVKFLVRLAESFSLQ
jgi:hypothetical protein